MFTYGYSLKILFLFVGGPVSNSTDWFGDTGHSNTTILPGCNPFKQSWCLHEHKIYFFQYLIGLPIITIGYCSSSLLCYTIFSMILGPWPQVCCKHLIHTPHYICFLHHTLSFTHCTYNSLHTLHIYCTMYSLCTYAILTHCTIRICRCVYSSRACT